MMVSRFFFVHWFSHFPTSYVPLIVKYRKILSTNFLEV